MKRLILASIIACVGVYSLLAAALDFPVGSYNYYTGVCVGVTTPQGVVPCKGAPRHTDQYVSPDMTFAMLQASFANKSK